MKMKLPPFHARESGRKSIPRCSQLPLRGEALEDRCLLTVALNSVKLWDAIPTFDTGDTTSPEAAIVFAENAVTLEFEAGDTAVLSSTPDGNGPLAVDNFITINGENICLGIPGQQFEESCFGTIIGPVSSGLPMEEVFELIGPIDVAPSIPVGRTTVLFEARDFGVIAGTTDVYLVTSAELAVDIDVKPGSNPNSINLRSNGLLAVAILSTSIADGDSTDLDATMVNPSTIQFGDAREGFSRVNALRWATEDVDGDGDLDLIVHFSVREIRETGALDADSVDAILAAETLDGTKILGTDSVRMVPEM